MACDFILPNGEESRLYKELRDQYGEAMADHVYKHIHSDAFMAFFGNWKLFHSYAEVQKNVLKAGHRTKQEADAHAAYINKTYGPGSASVSKAQGAKFDWRVSLNRPYRQDVSKIVNEQGEPLIVYHLDGTQTFTSDKEKAGSFVKPADYEGTIPLPGKGDLMPMFLNVRDLEGANNLGRPSDGSRKGTTIKVYSEKQVQASMHGIGIEKDPGNTVPKQPKTPNSPQDTGEQLTLDLATDAELKARKDIAHRAVGVLKKKLSIYSKEGKKKSEFAKTTEKEIAKMQKLLIRNKDMEAIMAFVEFANTQSHKSIDVRIKEIQEELNDPNITKEGKRDVLKKLARAADYLSAFDLVTDIYADLNGQQFSHSQIEGEVIDLNFRARYIDSVQGHIAEAKRNYLEASKEIVADFLMEYNQDPTLSKEDILGLLTHVNDDISWTQWKLDSLAESNDQVLALVDRVLSTERAKINLSIEGFKNSSLKEAITALEAYQKSQGVVITKYDKLYDFMLIKDEEGKVTGKYIEPNSAKGKALPKEQRDFLVLFDEEYKQAQKLLPPGYRRGNTLIPILKSGGERAFQDVKGVKSGIQAAKTYTSEQFKRTADDTEFGEVLTDEKGVEHRFIPIHYTANVGTQKGGVRPEDLSLDMASNLLRFMTMSKNYESMTRVIVELEATRNLVAERKVTVTKGGVPLIDKALGRSGEKVFVTKKGKEGSNSYKRLEDFFEMHIYGKGKEDEGTLFGTKDGLDKAKTLDMLSRYTSLSSLALNLYSGINNATIGQVMNAIEGAGGQFYSRKNFRSARLEYSKNLPGIIKDATARFSTNTLNLWMEAYDVFQEFDEFGKPLESNMKAGRYASKVSFIVQNAGEHMIQSELAIAMAKSHRILDGKIVSYHSWVKERNKPLTKASRAEFETLGQDVYSSIEVVDGKVNIKGLTSNKEMIQFTERIKGVYQRLHGNYSKKDQAGINKKALGRLVMLFRKWLKPGWNRRFAKETFDSRDAFDQRLGDNIAGNYTTAFRFLKQMYQDNKGAAAFLAIINKDKSGWNNLPEWKKSNIKRTFAETAFILGSLLLIAALGEPDDDDDWTKNMAIYQAHRLYSELRFYSSPTEALKVLRSPSASLNTVEKFGKTIGYLTEPVFDMSFEWERYQSGPHKGELKVGVHAWSLVPYGNQVSRAMSPEENAKFISKLY